MYEAIGVSKGTYIRWEAGHAIPSDMLAKLSKMGFNINYVVTGEQEPKSEQQYLESQAEHAFKVLLREADKIKAVNIYDKDTYNMLVMMFMRQLRKSAGHSEVQESSVETASKRA